MYIYIYLINYYSDRGYRTMESTTNQKSITRPKNRGQEWKYDSNIPQNSGRSPLVMLKFIFKGLLGSPDSFAGNPGGVRVGPCLATGLFPCILLISLWHRTFINYYAALNHIYCRVVDFALETRYNRHIPSLLKPAVYMLSR